MLFLSELNSMFTLLITIALGALASSAVTTYWFKPGGWSELIEKKCKADRWIVKLLTCKVCFTFHCATFFMLALAISSNWGQAHVVVKYITEILAAIDIAHRLQGIHPSQVKGEYYETETSSCPDQKDSKPLP